MIPEGQHVPVDMTMMVIWKSVTHIQSKLQKRQLSAIRSQLLNHSKMTLSPLPLLFASVIATSPDSTVSNTANEATRDTLQCVSILSLSQDHNKHFIVSFILWQFVRFPIYCHEIPEKKHEDATLRGEMWDLTDTTIDLFPALTREWQTKVSNVKVQWKTGERAGIQEGKPGTCMWIKLKSEVTCPIIIYCVLTCILSWWWGLTFFLSGAESDSRPPWSTWKRRSSLPLTIWKENGGPFLGVSLSLTTSWRMLLPTDSPSCRTQGLLIHLFLQL